MKVRPVETELYHEDTQTDEQRDVTKLIVAFRNFANAPKSLTAEICATELRVHQNFKPITFMQFLFVGIHNEIRIYRKFPPERTGISRRIQFGELRYCVGHFSL